MRAAMTAESIKQLIEHGESLTVAFARRVSPAYINERRVIETMACMANAEGGVLLVGVDGDGTVSGCYPFHGDRTDPAALAASIFRQTSPGLPADVTVAEVGGREVVAIRVAAQPSPVATRWGVYRTRRLNAAGTPECAGMDPAYLFTRYRDANGMDWALAPAGGATLGDIDAEAVGAFRATLDDARLRALDPEPLIRSLGFFNDSAEPLTFGAVALFGTPEAVRRHLPHHQLVIADRRGTPRTLRSSAALAPMLADLGRNRARLGAAFPLVINALLHRDYFMPGPVYVSLDADGARVSSPGAAPRGVDLAAAAAGRATYAPRSLYLTTAVARTGITEGAGAGLAGLGRRVSFAGSHEQGVVASVAWEPAGVAAAGGEGGASQSKRPSLAAGSNEERALRAVREAGPGGASSSEVARRAGLSNQQAYRALRKLVGAGAIRRTGETRMTRYLP